MVSNPPATQERQVRSLDREIPCRRALYLTPVFLPGESHGQKSLAGYNPLGRKESDMTEATEHMHKQRERMKEGRGREEGRKRRNGGEFIEACIPFPSPIAGLTAPCEETLLYLKHS